jgi:hypothetical protein
MWGFHFAPHIPETPEPTNRRGVQHGTAPALISIDEYLCTSYHPDAHFVDNKIEERHGSECEHARPQNVIAAIF